MLPIESKIPQEEKVENNELKENEIQAELVRKEPLSRIKKSIIFIALVIVLLFTAGFSWTKWGASFLIKNNEQQNKNLTSQKFDFSNIESIKELSGQEFTATQQKSILQNGFVVRPYEKVFYEQNLEAEVSRNDDWSKIYSDFGGGNICERQSGNAVYITADAMLHLYHRLFDAELEYLEDVKFLPALKEFSENMLQLSLTRLAQSASPEEKQGYETLSVYFAVPTVILNSVDLESANEYNYIPKAYFQQLTDKDLTASLTKIASNLPADVLNKTSEELNRVWQAEEKSPSFFNDQSTDKIAAAHDYTQYTPRSHYNKNALGQAYFKAMMWYGRNGFALNSDSETLNAQQTLTALSLVNLLQTNNKNLTTWKSLKEAIDYLVGNADDLSVNDYVAFAQGNLSLDQVKKVLPQMQQLKKPQIMSSLLIGEKVLDTTKEELQNSTQAFYLFSQRFTPDAYIFTNLTQGEEKPDAETQESLPSMPTALMVPTAFGNQFAQEQFNAWVTKNHADASRVIDKKMKILQNEFSSWDETKWTSNNYVSWLYTLQALQKSQTTKTVSNAAMQAKNLNTFLGSYTELKHDTVLYAKQSYSEMGGGGDCEIPAVPYGYVEPNLIFWQRLQNLITTNQQWLSKSGLMEEKDNLLWRFDELLKTVDFYQKVATSQEKGTKLTDDDYENLRTSFAQLDFLAAPIFNVASLEKNARSALITDVGTDGVKKEILYEANAIPDEILMAVDDFNGRRLVRGLTYSYREFTGPLTTRKTDEDWQQQVYLPQTELPAQPQWWQPYFGE